MIFDFGISGFRDLDDLLRTGHSVRGPSIEKPALSDSRMGRKSKIENSP